MGKRIQVTKHLPVEQLADRYQHETDGRTRTHWQVLWQLTCGKTTQEVAALTGLSVAWIRELVRRYNRVGPAVVADQRHNNPGAPHVLTTKQEADLVAALEGPAPNGEIWTGPLVAQWITQQARHPVTNYCGWLYLQRLNYRQRMTRPRHVNADPVAQEGFKKTATHRPPGASRTPRHTRGTLGI